MKNFFRRLFGKIIGGNYFLALDFGSSSIKSLLFKISEDGKRVDIQGFGESRQFPLSDNIANKEEGKMSRIVLAAQKSIGEACKNTKIRTPLKVILGAAGDLLHGDSITKRYIREDAKEKINLIELKNIIQKTQWSAWDNIRKFVRDETGYSEFNIKLINSRIQEIKVDGYRVTNPLGFSGREIVISIFNVYSTEEHLEFLNNIAGRLNLELSCIAAEPYAVAQALSAGSNDKISALLLDVGDFTTDITFIQENKVRFIKTIALGGRIFNQRLSNELCIDNNDAEAIKIKYGNNLLSPTVTKKIAHIIKRDIDIWLNALELSLTSISKQEILPSDILLYGAGSQLPDLKTALEDGNWRKNLSLPRRLVVNLLLPESFFNIINLPAEFNRPQFTALCALSVLSLDFIAHEDQISQSLRRISRIVSQ